MNTFFITGATGNIGKLVVQELLNKGHHVKAAILSGESLPHHQQLELIEFDFTKPETWKPALDQVDRVFLMRPPHIANIKRDMLPFLRYLKDSTCTQTVFMSVQGADKNPWVPHRKVELALHELAIPHSLLRPSFFMQNLTTTHLPEIRDENQLMIPAGKGKTNFIDGFDIACCAAEILLKPNLHNKAYTVTGLQSYSYQEIADKLSQVLGRTITYKNPGALGFLAYHRKKRALGMSLVMLALYSIVKLGKGDITTTDTEIILQRKPKDLTTFLLDHRHLFFN